MRPDQYGWARKATPPFPVIQRAASAIDGNSSRGSGQLVDPVRQDVGLEPAVEPRGQLARGDQEDVARPVGCGLVQRDEPVVRDREHVVARSRVVLHQPGGGRLTVRVVGVGVQLAAEPRAGMIEGRWHGGHGI